MKGRLTTYDRGSDPHFVNKIVDVTNVCVEQDARAVGDGDTDIGIASRRQPPQFHQITDVEQVGDEKRDVG